MDIPVVITIEAGLSFLGLGVRPPLASWGTLIQDSYQFLSDSWIPVLVSSAALAVVTLGFTLFGEALRCSGSASHPGALTHERTPGIGSPETRASAPDR